MSTIQNIFQTISDFSRGTDWFYVLKNTFFICVTVLFLGGVLRLMFGRGSNIVRAVSACITLAMMYLFAVILYVLIPQARSPIAYLPFISASQESFSLWDIHNLSVTALCAQVLQLFFLSFLINLAEALIPQGDKILTWYGYRLLTVFICLAIYMGIRNLVNIFLPEIFGSWAPYILIAMWIFILLTGLLNLLITAVLAVAKPMVAALYAFFFTNLFGQQMSKAIATTVLGISVMACVHELGLNSFAFSSFSMRIYGPASVLTIVTLYLFGKML